MIAPDDASDMQFTYFRLGTLCIQIVLRRRYDNYAKSKSRVAVAYRRETLIAHASAARSAGSRYLRQDSDISRALYDKQLFWLSQSYGLGRRLAVSSAISMKRTYMRRQVRCKKFQISRNPPHFPTISTSSTWLSRSWRSRGLFTRRLIALIIASQAYSTSARKILQSDALIDKVNCAIL